MVVAVEVVVNDEIVADSAVVAQWEAAVTGTSAEEELADPRIQLDPGMTAAERGRCSKIMAEEPWAGPVHRT